ncbi:MULTISPECIES: TetR/AcrR family transcriptional regulator [unclassified Clostridioides]|uniref:TetR/AcrR family transcriptional regulator n=1 Tax=unclassified Clostridioides TaxID=2635829 RepID=UPI001D1255C8|nr:TetR/AcrR family transcriptional regulator [Clostridioides sp. ES-S-0171-01]MCC0686508.1 TetR/AcrR family transcriptional regulator [Clostridioides sp. ES-S-0056-01]MCC0713971.1 TetR/AcrR family transcriptional regulator [Clostridioides sp. ES-S-0077-01]UDN55095.1 TetR/AcrR family transcriptional regulator [Clostridioides sp. ES-S-0054-01]
MSELSKRDKEKIQRKNEIIDKAERLFCLNGFDDTTMNELAKEVEHTKRTVYKYFSCKEDLFFAVVLRGYKRLWDIVKIESAKGKTGFEKVKLLYFAFHKFYCLEPSLLSLMGMIGIVKTRNSDTEIPFKEKFFSFNKFMFDEIQEMFETGKNDGSIRHDVEIPTLMYSSIFTLTGFFNLLSVAGKSYLNNFNIDEEKFIETTLALFIDSLKA